MAVQKTMNIVATTGTYTDNQGQEKKRYLTVGTLFIYDDGGMSIKLDAIPTHFNGNLAIYERENRNNSQTNNQGSYAPQGQQYQQPQQQGSYAQQGQQYQQQGGYTPQNQQQGYPRQ